VDSMTEKKAETPAILLVEDNDVNRVVALNLLRSLGYLNVKTASNGREAVQACRERSFELILMDCQMPIMDGYEATRAIRALGLSVPIIAFSSIESAADRLRCIEVGMNDFLEKPTHLEVLAAALLNWVPAARRPEPRPARQVRRGAPS